MSISKEEFFGGFRQRTIFSDVRIHPRLGRVWDLFPVTGNILLPNPEDVVGDGGAVFFLINRNPSSATVKDHNDVTVGTVDENEMCQVHLVDGNWVMVCDPLAGVATTTTTTTAAGTTTTGGGTTTTGGGTTTTPSSGTTTTTTTGGGGSSTVATLGEYSPEMVPGFRGTSFSAEGL